MWDVNVGFRIYGFFDLCAYFFGELRVSEQICWVKVSQNHVLCAPD